MYWYFINFIIELFFGKPKEKEYESVERSIERIDEEAEKYPEIEQDDLCEIEAYERQEHQEQQQEQFEEIEEEEKDCYPDTCWGECQAQGWCDIAKDYRERIHPRNKIVYEFVGKSKGKKEKRKKKRK